MQRALLHGNPQEMPYDDTVCYVCGADLGDAPSTEASRFTEADPQFHGYCSVRCAERDNPDSCEAHIGRHYL
jgi:hypothetical protein